MNYFLCNWREASAAATTDSNEEWASDADSTAAPTAPSKIGASAILTLPFKDLPT